MVLYQIIAGQIASEKYPHQYVGRTSKELTLIINALNQNRVKLMYISNICILPRRGYLFEAKTFQIKDFTTPRRATGFQNIDCYLRPLMIPKHISFNRLHYYY